MYMKSPKKKLYLLNNENETHLIVYRPSDTIPYNLVRSEENQPWQTIVRMQHVYHRLFFISKIPYIWIVK